MKNKNRVLNSNFIKIRNRKRNSALVIPISFFKFTEKRMAEWYTYWIGSWAVGNLPFWTADSSNFRTGKMKNMPVVDQGGYNNITMGDGQRARGTSIYTSCTYVVRNLISIHLIYVEYNVLHYLKLLKMSKMFEPSFVIYYLKKENWIQTSVIAIKKFSLKYLTHNIDLYIKQDMSLY